MKDPNTGVKCVADFDGSYTDLVEDVEFAEEMAFEIDDLYDLDTDYDEEFADELGDFDYFAKAEVEDNSCPIH